MSKPALERFPAEFERLLARADGRLEDTLSDNRIRHLRRLVSDIRKVYFKRTGKYHDFRERKNRAGYLAAFGERHAYLAYKHLKLVEGLNKKAVPSPSSRKELTLTLLGGATGIESFGAVLYYNEHASRIHKLNLNVIDKVEDWWPAAGLVANSFLPNIFPKLQVSPQFIAADLGGEDTVLRLAPHYDRLAATNILVIYNVLNEIPVGQRHLVTKTVRYLLRQCEDEVLVLLAEPTGMKVRNRVVYACDLLADEGVTVSSSSEGDTFEFTQRPALIRPIREIDDPSHINHKLFRYRPKIKHNPKLYNSLKRVHLAIHVDRSAAIKALQLKARKTGKQVVPDEGEKEPADHPGQTFFRFEEIEEKKRKREKKKASPVTQALRRELTTLVKELRSRQVTGERPLQLAVAACLMHHLDYVERDILRTECERLGCRNSPNFTKYMRDGRGDLFREVKGGKKIAGWKAKQRGEDLGRDVDAFLASENRPVGKELKRLIADTQRRLKAKKKAAKKKPAKKKVKKAAKKTAKKKAAKKKAAKKKAAKKKAAKKKAAKKKVKKKPAKKRSTGKKRAMGKKKKR